MKRKQHFTDKIVGAETPCLSLMAWRSQNCLPKKPVLVRRKT